MVSNMSRRSEDKMRSSQGLASRERFDGQMEVILTQGPKTIIVDFDHSTTLKEWSDNLLIDAWEALEIIDQNVDYTEYTCVAYASTNGGSRWPASKYSYSMRDVLERIHSEVQYTQETTLINMDRAALCAPSPCGIPFDSLIKNIQSWTSQCPGMLKLLDAISTVLAAAHPTGRGRNLTDSRMIDELIGKI